MSRRVQFHSISLALPPACLLRGQRRYGGRTVSPHFNRLRASQAPCISLFCSSWFIRMASSARTRVKCDSLAADGAERLSHTSAASQSSAVSPARVVTCPRLLALLLRQPRLRPSLNFVIAVSGVASGRRRSSSALQPYL